MLDAQVKFAGDYSTFGVFTPGSPASLATYTEEADVTGSGFNAAFTGAHVIGGILTIQPPPNPLALGINNTQSAPQDYWSSNATDNSDAAGATDHMVTFYITWERMPGNYVIAFEDLSIAQGSDRDFNDLVIQINSGLAPAPEPSTMAIAALGALGMIGYGLRRRKSKGA